jgi:hypothetical protein
MRAPNPSKRHGSINNFASPVAKAATSAMNEPFSIPAIRALSGLIPYIFTYSPPFTRGKAGEGNRTLVARVVSLDDCFWWFHAVFGCYWFFGSLQFPTAIVDICSSSSLISSLEATATAYAHIATTAIPAIQFKANPTTSVQIITIKIETAATH